MRINKQKLRQSSELALWVMPIIIYIAWLFAPIFVPALKFTEEWGMSTSSFSIFCGSLVTLSGAVVAILVGAMLFITQYLSINMSHVNEAITTECKWLSQGLYIKTCRKLKLIKDLEKLHMLCKDAVYVFPNEEKVRETMEVNSHIIEVILKLSDKTKGKLKTQDIEMLDELVSHLYKMFTSLAKTVSFFQLSKMIGNMKKLASSFGVLLIATMVLLVFATVESTDKSFVTSGYRLDIAIGLIFLLIYSIRLLFNTVSVNWDLLRFVLLGPVED